MEGLNQIESARRLLPKNMLWHWRVQKTLRPDTAQYLSLRARYRYQGPRFAGHIANWGRIRKCCQPLFILPFSRITNTCNRINSCIHVIESPRIGFRVINRDSKSFPWRVRHWAIHAYLNHLAFGGLKMS